MITIGFFTTGLTYRGTEVAIYDYADYNEKILGNMRPLDIAIISGNCERTIKINCKNNEEAKKTLEDLWNKIK